MITINPINVIFYVFAFMAVVSAIFVITSRHPVKSVLSLVATFFAMAGIWMLLQAEFLSLILLLVYVGAVMTLFLFVVMMIDVDQAARRQHFVNYSPLAFLLAVLVVGLLLEAFYLHSHYLKQTIAVVKSPLSENNLHTLGLLLFSDYIYPFEIAGVILLAAIIAAITLTHREPIKRRIQNIDEQINMQPKDAVRIVKSPRLDHGTQNGGSST